MSGPRDARKWRVLLWAALAAGCADVFENSNPTLVVSPAANFPFPAEMTRTQEATVAVVVVDTLNRVAITSGSVKWESSDNSIITVERLPPDSTDTLSAKVTAHEVGAAEVTATVTPGNGMTPIIRSFSVRVLERWIAVSVGRDLACGLNVDSRAYCWEGDLQPSLVPGLAGFTATDIQVGHTTACVMVHHTPLCWGQNGLGEIGNGDELRHTIPVEGAINPTPEALVALSAGGTSFCGNFDNPGRRDSFFVQCWGNSAFRQLGVPPPNTTCRFSFKDIHCRRELIGQDDDTLRILMHAGSVDAGESHACAIEEAPTLGLLHCWGASATGQLGSPHDLLDCPSEPGLRCSGPEVVDSSLHFISVSAGWDRFVPNPSAQSTSWFGEGHTCALAEDLTLYCWGKNDYDQLGAASDAMCNRLPTATPAAVPCRLTPLAVQAPAPGTFKAVSAGSEHTCGIMANDSIYCWGSDSLGQLGDSSTQSRGTPAPVRSDRLFKAVSAGPYRTCGLTLDDGRIFCWGDSLWFKPTKILEPQ